MYGRVTNPDNTAHGLVRISDGRDFGYSSLESNHWVRKKILSDALRRKQGFVDVDESRFFSGWQHYQSWFFRLNLAEYLGLAPSSKLANLPAWSVAYPWSKIGPREMLSWLPKKLARVRKREGGKIPFYWGPKTFMEYESRNSAPFEFRQFRELTKSISMFGLRDLCNWDDPLLVDSLKVGKDKVWTIFSGSHRIAVASSLGLEEVHAEYGQEIERSSVGDWPQVLNKTFSKNEALTVFDSLFEGKVMAVTHRLLRDLEDN